MSLTGRLLVASPDLADPNFARSVVLILEHGPQGALGVVLNRPSRVAVDDLLPEWAGAVTDPDVVFSGGPVQQDGALGLVALRPATQSRAAADGLVGGPAGGPAGAADTGNAHEEIFGIRRLTDSLGLVDLEAPVLEVAGSVVALRVFAGYAGWAPAQLESEISEGSWFAVDARSSDPFDGDPAHLWRTVLRRQRSALALLASFPADPSLN